MIFWTACFLTQAAVVIYLASFAIDATLHNLAVERIRWIGPRPSLRLPPEDAALRRRMETLRHLGNVMAAAGKEEA